MNDLEETLVAALMMRPGLDATMIGPIEHVQRDDTDFLCVSSFNHSFAVLSWLTADKIALQWERLGLAGKIVEPGLDGRRAMDGDRWIYHLQLVPSLVVEDTVNQLSQILMDRNVRTVSIGLPGLPPDKPVADSRKTQSNRTDQGRSVDQNKNAEQASRAVPDSSQTASDQSPRGNGDERTEGRPAIDTGGVPPEPNHPEPNQPIETYDAASQTGDEPEWEHLERLVDDFDSLDL